jgi:sugar phosphate permease
VILINLALTGVTTFGFGFTKTLWFAVIMRFLTGAMNGELQALEGALEHLELFLGSKLLLSL